MPILYFAQLNAKLFSAFACVKIKVFRFGFEGTAGKITYLHIYLRQVLNHLFGMKYLIEFFSSKESELNACLL